MPPRLKILLLLSILTIASTWLLNRLSETEPTQIFVLRHEPDNYMSHLSTLTMNADGTPKNKLYADYMAHYPDDDTTKLINPSLEIFNPDTPPTVITAKTGWVSNDNEIILLTGKTKLLQMNEKGVKTLEVITSDVRVIMDKEYAETDKVATIFREKTTTKSIGMNAYLGENRLELLSNVYTKILP